MRVLYFAFEPKRDLLEKPVSINSGSPSNGVNIVKIKIAGIGEVLWDVLPEGRQLGGAPANFVHHVNALGGQGVLVSRVGDDELGGEVFELLAQRGINPGMIAVDPDHPTGTVLAEVDAQGKAEYVFPPDVAWDFMEMRSELKSLAGEVGAVCFGSLAQRSPCSRATIQGFLNMVPRDSLKVFDINLRGSFYTREVVEDSIERADVLKISDEELPVVAAMFGMRGSDEEMLAALIEGYDVDLCALTRGAEGSLLVTRAESHDHPGLPTRVKDTIGAGDSFTAALTLGLAVGWNLEKINERANAVAAAVCGQTGGMPLLPDSLRILP